MKFILALLMLLHSVLAQRDYRCDCAIFTDLQIDDDDDDELIPLILSMDNTVDPNTCNMDEGPNHPCARLCNQFGRNDIDNNAGLCGMKGENNERCVGGLMCEIMFAAEHDEVKYEPLRMYYRVPECDDDNEKWERSGYEMRQDLCCHDGIYEPCTGVCPSCYPQDYGYCECGLFVEEQFEEIDDDDDEIVLPLKMIGSNSTETPAGPEFCARVGTSLDPCRQMCEAQADELFAQYRLNDFVGDSSVTYGQYFCTLLYHIDDDFDDLEDDLGIWSRVPNCDRRKWYELYLKHPEELCCDDEEHVYPCPRSARVPDDENFW